jgi:hypothetical protein
VLLCDGHRDFGQSALLGAAAANELAVAGNLVRAVGVDEVASSAAGDRVARVVFRVHDIAAGAGEQSISAAAAEEDVIASEPVEEVGAAEASKHVWPLGTEKDIAARGARACHLLRRLSPLSRGRCRGRR